MTGTARRLRGSSEGHSSLLELVVIVAVAIGLALLIQAFLVKPYRIPSESMEPTLDVGQRVLVSRVNYKFSDPDRGDIVVFHPPKGAESNACGADHADNELCPRPTPQRAGQAPPPRLVGTGYEAPFKASIEVEETPCRTSSLARPGRRLAAGRRFLRGCPSASGASRWRRPVR